MVEVDTFKFKLILADHDLGKYIPKFEEHEITDKMFITLTDCEITSIVDSKVGPMRKTKDAIQEVRNYDNLNGDGSWLKSCMDDHFEDLKQSTSSSTPFERKKKRRQDTPRPSISRPESVPTPLSKHRDSIQLACKRLNYQVKKTILEENDKDLMPPPPPKRILQETVKGNGQQVEKGPKKSVDKVKKVGKNENIEDNNEPKAKKGKINPKQLEFIQQSTPRKTRQRAKIQNDENSVPKVGQVKKTCAKEGKIPQKLKN